MIRMIDGWYGTDGFKSLEEMNKDELICAIRQLSVQLELAHESSQKISDIFRGRVEREAGRHA